MASSSTLQASCFSAGRPRKRTASQQVEMDMKDRLPGPCAVVHHEAVVRQAFLGRHLPRNREQMPHERFVLGFDGIGARDGFTGHDEEMRRGSRVNIAEGTALLILIHEIRRQLFIGDFLEEGFFRHSGQR